MAYYCTVSDLVDNMSERVLIQLTDDATPPVAVNEERCLKTIEEASEIIDARLRARYKNLPLQEPSAMIRGICADIVAYKLYSRRNKGDIENVYQRYKAALEMLDKISLAEQTPDIAGGITGGAYRVSRRKAERVFTDELLRRF